MLFTRDKKMYPALRRFRRGEITRTELGAVLMSRARDRAAEQLELRTRTRDGQWVVGRWLVRGGEVVLEALSTDSAFTLEVDRMTTQLAEMYRWVTRQAAHQYVRRHGLRLEPIHLATFQGPVDVVGSSTDPTILPAR